MSEKHARISPLLCSTCTQVPTHTLAPTHTHTRTQWSWIQFCYTAQHTHTLTHKHTHILTHVHMPVHIQAYTHTHTCTHANTHPCLHTHTHGHMPVHIQAYTHTHTCTHANIYSSLHTHTHVHMPIYIQAYTHTHTQDDALCQWGKALNAMSKVADEGWAPTHTMKAGRPLTPWRLGAHSHHEGWAPTHTMKAGRPLTPWRLGTHSHPQHQTRGPAQGGQGQHHYLWGREDQDDVRHQTSVNVLLSIFPQTLCIIQLSEACLKYTAHCGRPNFTLSCTMWNSHFTLMHTVEHPLYIPMDTVEHPLYMYTVKCPLYTLMHYGTFTLHSSCTLWNSHFTLSCTLWNSHFTLSCALWNSHFTLSCALWNSHFTLSCTLWNSHFTLSCTEWNAHFTPHTESTVLKGTWSHNFEWEYAHVHIHLLCMVLLSTFMQQTCEGLLQTGPPQGLAHTGSFSTSEEKKSLAGDVRHTLWPRSCHRHTMPYSKQQHSRPCFCNFKTSAKNEPNFTCRA